MLNELNKAIDMYGIRLTEKQDNLLHVATQLTRTNEIITDLLNKNIEPSKLESVYNMIVFDIEELGYKISLEDTVSLKRYLNYLQGEMGYAKFLGRQS